MNKRVLSLMVVCFLFSCAAPEYKKAEASDVEKFPATPNPNNPPPKVLETIRIMTMHEDKGIEIMPISGNYAVKYRGVNETGTYAETIFYR